MKKLRIEGEIGWDINSEKVQSQLDQLKLSPDDELLIIINSGGGSVFEGYAIYNKLKAIPNKKIGKVEGVCASIATLILLGCDVAQMSEVSLFMVHKASTQVQGNSEELQKQMDILNVIDSTLNSVYAAKTGKSEQEIEEILSHETYMNSETALAEGWIDEVVDKIETKSKTAAMLNQMAASINLLNNKNMGVIKDFFSANFGTHKAEKPEGEDSKEELKKEEGAPTQTPEAAENPLTETEAEEQAVEEEMTLESVNSKVDRLIEVVDALAESLAVETTVEEARIETQVEANFTKLVANLQKSKGIVPKSNGVLDKETDTYVPTGAKFRSRMKVIDSKTRR